MSANTMTTRQILLKIAEDNNLDRGAYVSHVTDALHFECAYAGSGLTATDDDHYVGALVQVLGKGIRTVTDYVGLSKQIVVDTGFDVPLVANDVVQLAYWKADQRLKAQRAMNAAVLASYRRGQACWYREIKQDRTTATLTLTAGVYDYTLPSNVTFLSRVGIQEVGSAVEWYPRANFWRTSGQEGALRLQFYCTARHDFVSEYGGYKLCLWYESREPVLSSEVQAGAVTGTGQGAAGATRITTSAAHGLAAGDTITITNVGGTVEVNGTWSVSGIDSTTQFQIPVAYQHALTSNGSWAFVGVSYADGFATQLPLDYFAVASEIFKRRLLAGDTGDALQTDSMVLPQLQTEAANALARTGALRDPLPAGPILPLE